MKYLKIIGKYQIGVRLSSLFLILLMSWSVFQGVFLFGRYRSRISDLTIFKSAESTNAYYMQIFLTMQDIITDTDIKAAEEAVEALAEHPDVAYVFTIQYAPIPYENTSSGIILYDPEMVEFFPELKSIGIDFSLNPDGCILASPLFSGYEAGESVLLNQQPFPVAGWLSNPYNCMRFTTSGSSLSVSQLFKLAGDVVIMQATDSVIRQVSAISNRIQMESNFIVVFNDGVSFETQESILKEAAPKHVPMSFETLLENTEPKLRKELTQDMARPLFLAIASLIAFLSILILTFKKKEKELAIWYICGASRMKCGLVNFMYFSILALIPVLLNVAFVLYWQTIDWQAALKWITKSDLQKILGETNYIRIMSRIGYLKNEFKLTGGCFTVIFGYYGASVLLALAATVGGMRKHSPLTYLRGANK